MFMFFSTFASSVERTRYIYCMFAIVCVSVTTGGPTTDAQFGECVRAIQVVASQYQQKTKHHCLACLWVGRASCTTWAKRGKQTTAKSWCILLWARKASLSCIRFVAYHLGQQKNCKWWFESSSETFKTWIFIAKREQIEKLAFFDFAKNSKLGNPIYTGCVWMHVCLCLSWHQPASNSPLSMLSSNVFDSTVQALQLNHRTILC